MIVIFEEVMSICNAMQMRRWPLYPSDVFALQLRPLYVQLVP